MDEKSCVYLTWFTDAKKLELVGLSSVLLRIFFSFPFLTPHPDYSFFFLYFSWPDFSIFAASLSFLHSTIRYIAPLFSSLLVYSFFSFFFPFLDLIPMYGAMTVLSIIVT